MTKHANDETGRSWRPSTDITKDSDNYWWQTCQERVWSHQFLKLKLALASHATFCLRPEGRRNLAASPVVFGLPASAQPGVRACAGFQLCWKGERPVCSPDLRTRTAS